MCPAVLSLHDRAAAARARRVGRARRLLGGAVLVLALLVWGRTNPGDYLVVHALLDHPIVLGVLAWGLAAAGVAGHLDDPQRRIIAGVLLAGVGATGFALAGLVLSAQVSPSRTEDVLADPAGGDLSAVVSYDGDERHPVTRVVVEGSAASLTAHRYDVACIQSPPGERASVSWSRGGPLLVVLADGTRREIRVGANGAPDEPLRVGLLCTRG